MFLLACQILQRSRRQQRKNSHQVRVGMCAGRLRPSARVGRCRARWGATAMMLAVTPEKRRFMFGAMTRTAWSGPPASAEPFSSLKRELAISSVA
jgi:hypothetical protein